MNAGFENKMIPEGHDSLESDFISLHAIFSHYTKDDITFKEWLTKELIEYTNVVKSSNLTTLFIFSGSVELCSKWIPFLVSNGDDLYKEQVFYHAAIFYAIHQGNVEKVRILLEVGLDVDYYYPSNTINAIQYITQNFLEDVISINTPRHENLLTILHELLMYSRVLKEEHVPHWFKFTFDGIKKAHLNRRVTMALVCKHYKIHKGIARILDLELKLIRLDESWN